GGGSGKKEIGPFASVALDPDFAAHQFGEALADGQAEAGAAVVASGGGVHLLEGLEEPVLFVHRDADSGVAHRKVQQPLLRVTKKIGVGLVARLKSSGAAPGRSDLDGDLALVGEFNGVANEVDQDLA